MIGKVDERKIKRRLAARHRQRSDAPLKGRNPLFEHINGRVIDWAVAEALDLKVEESRAVVGAVELVGNGLVDRDRDGFGRRLACIAAITVRVPGRNLDFRIDTLNSKLLSQPETSPRLRMGSRQALLRLSAETMPVIANGG